MLKTLDEDDYIDYESQEIIDDEEDEKWYKQENKLYKLLQKLPIEIINRITLYLYTYPKVDKEDHEYHKFEYKRLWPIVRIRQPLDMYDHPEHDIYKFYMYNCKDKYYYYIPKSTIGIDRFNDSMGHFFDECSCKHCKRYQKKKFTILQLITGRY